MKILHGMVRTLDLRCGKGKTIPRWVVECASTRSGELVDPAPIAIGFAETCPGQCGNGANTGLENDDPFFSPWTI